MNESDRSAKTQRVTFELVLHQLRKHNFAVLSTVGEDGMAYSAGVNYGLARKDAEFAMYVMTRRHLKKARNIARNPNVSLVIPLARRLLWFLPPPCIQVSGRAEILDWTDASGTEAFRRFWMGRRILDMYQESYRRGETRTCFVKITPYPVISTYMVGYSAWELRSRGESASGKVRIPPELLPAPAIGGRPEIENRRSTMKSVLKVMVGALAAAAVGLMPVAALADIGAAPTGGDFGQHVAACAHEMGGFTGSHNPGMHQGFAGWDGATCGS